MTKIYKKITKCRICEDKKLLKVYKFNDINLTGIFPSQKKKKIDKTPLEVVFSKKSKLLQLRHNYDVKKLFGKNYGYRSNLNSSMVAHLKKKYLKLKKKLKLKKEDKILDIGSNDGTFLNFFSNQSTRVGCDPSAKKFKKYYNKRIKIINKIFDKNTTGQLKYKFKIISAIAMFYDLDRPLVFCKNIEKIIDEEGIFHVEIAYLPDIFKKFSFDTFCQEHLTYFSYISFKNLISKTNFKIIDYSRNSINGGSINFDLALKVANHKPKTKKLQKLHDYELKNKFDKFHKYKSFFKQVEKNINEIKTTIQELAKKNKKIFGFGASTKGNVTLQLCKLDNRLIKGIYDVNREKFNSYTPGTKILIKDEKIILKDKPDYLVLLIWHFTSTIKEKFKKIKIKNMKYISLFPKLKITDKI